MKSLFFPGLTPGREDGAVLLFVVSGIALMFIALTALAIDSGHMVMVKNELQNSADAGALAGAAILLRDVPPGSVPPGSINTGANTEAEDLARENPAVGADTSSGSTADDKLDVVARRGHWSFSTETFTENNATEQLVGWEGMSATVLDVNPNFINAVQVTTTREHTKAIFSNFFGQNDHKIETDAVAYIGFAASVPPNSVDIPFAICKQYIYDDDGALICKVARAQNEGMETGGWTNFSQDRPESDPPETCDSSNASDVNNTILADIPPCEGLNGDSLTFGKGIGSINGAVSSSYSMVLEHCFVDTVSNPTCYQNDNRYNATIPWQDVTLPVVDCTEGEYEGGVCDDIKTPFVGVVTVDIIWMSYGKQNVPIEYHYNDIDWKCSDADIDWDADCSDLEASNPELCWQEFQDAFDWDFGDPDGDGLPEINGIYFAPSCEYTEPTGGTGSDNFGIMAAIPVLVE